MIKHAYISILNKPILSSDNIEDIAFWSLEKLNYYLVSVDKHALDKALDEVKDQHGVHLKGIHLKDNFPLLEVSTIVPFLLGCETVSIVDICKVEDNVSELQMFSFSGYKKITSLEIASDVSFNSLYSQLPKSCPIFETKFRKFLILYSNLASIDLQFMTRGSFLSDHEVLGRKSDTHLDCLKLIEFTKALPIYEQFFSLEVAHLPVGLESRKTTFINSILSSAPTSSSNLPEISNYPKVYKFLSAYFYACSVIKADQKAMNSSFLYCFRALEAFCEGYLIMTGVATIGNFHDGRTGRIRKRDAFLINNNFVSGFGEKWGEMKKDSIVSRTIAAIDPFLTSSIDTALKLRNLFNLTHGDLKLTDNVFREIQINIKRYIVGLDISLSHSGFSWESIVDEFNSFQTYDFVDDLRSVVESDFSIEIFDNSTTSV